MRLTFDLPTHSNWSIFVSGQSLYSEGYGCVFDEFVYYVTRLLLYFFNTTYSYMFLLCYEDLYIQVVAQHILL
jgi:hypothetical protein